MNLVGVGFFVDRNEFVMISLGRSLRSVSFGVSLAGSSQAERNATADWSQKGNRCRSYFLVVSVRAVFFFVSSFLLSSRRKSVHRGVGNVLAAVAEIGESDRRTNGDPATFDTIRRPSSVTLPKNGILLTKTVLSDDRTQFRESSRTDRGNGAETLKSSSKSCSRHSR